ncbi:uncharacterized protein LOC112468000, partial [Temnothorax curvispinosus]|uniref:Uncharacterized protein LOC112468000 n=1 Tax=Temnothorax curvispinosus TaxID=300111 RepID=A0A6J1RD93_9HYME
MSNATGSGIVFEERNEAFYVSLPSHSSSFTAEAFAVKAALEKVEYEKAQGKNIGNSILILSDCQSVLKAIKNNRLDVYKNRYILDIRRRHFKLKREYGLTIVFGWIPAHCGYVGNEAADLMARIGAQGEADESIEVPILDYRSLFKQESWQRTQEVIVRESGYKGKVYFNYFYDKNKKKPWFQKIKADRYFYSFVNRIQANHYNLGESLARKGFIDSSECECGHEKEDINHVIWQCSIYDRQRERMGEELVKRGIAGTEAIEVIIQREDWFKLGVIYNF